MWVWSAMLRRAEVGHNVICTEWRQFRDPNFVEMATNMPSKVIVDRRNLYQPQKPQAEGSSNYSVGRAAIDRERENYGRSFRDF